MVRIASTLPMPASSDMSVMGVYVVHRPNGASEIIAVIPHAIRSYFRLTQREHMFHYRRFRGDRGGGEGRD